METKDKEEMITLTELKKRYGVTDKIVKEFFTEPDAYAENPFYRSAPPMKLYKIKRIKRVIKTKKFIDSMEKVSKRKESAQKAVKTKTDKTMEDIKKKIRKIDVRILDISDDDLRKRAIKDHDDFKMMISFERGNFDYISGMLADSLTVDRWTVNYIRHNLTEYDHELYNMKGSVGKHEAYIKYKKAVLRKIAKAYPLYKDECKRQIKRFEDQIKMFDNYKTEILK